MANQVQFPSDIKEAKVAKGMVKDRVYFKNRQGDIFAARDIMEREV